MKAEELRSKTEDQLAEELMGLRKEQFNFRFQQASGQLENTARVKVVRRNIARIKTILNEKKTGVAAPAKAAKPAAKKKKAATKKETKE